MDNNSKFSIKNSSNLQKYVFNYYQNKRILIHKIARAIKTCLPLPFEYNKLDESDIFLGGNILLQYHKYIESRTDVAKLMKRELINRKTSSCYICCNNLLETYGEKAFQMLEMHYAAEIHEIHRDITVLSSKFVSVCPNCHTISHSDIDLFEENKLKEYIEQQRRGAKYV